MSSDEFDITLSSEPGAILDRVLRKANLLDLTDGYLGAQIDYSRDAVAVFFTKEVTQDQMEDLKEEVDDDSLNIQLESSDDDPITWILRLEKVAEAGETQAAATGDVSVDVPLSGTVDVVSGSSPVTSEE